MKVYLAGPIRGQSYDGAVEWRQEATERLGEFGIETASPMRAKEFLRHEDVINGPYDYDVFCTSKGITSRDRYDVQSSDVILAYMKGSLEASIGTAVEFGWADAYRKPVVMVVEDGAIHDHPMLNEIAAFRVRDLDWALHVIVTLLNAPARCAM